MKRLYFTLFLTMVCCIKAETPPNPQVFQEEWRFIGASYGVNFYWKKDPTWGLIMIKAKNNSISAIDYTYKYQVRTGSSVLDEGKHYFTRLTSKGENVIKINRNFNDVTHVTVKDILIERNS